MNTRALPSLSIIGALTCCAFACSRAEPSELSVSSASLVSSASPAVAGQGVLALHNSGSATGASSDGAPSFAPSSGAALVAPSASASSAKPHGKARGASCSSARDCRAGLTCCETSFRGHCGGAALPGLVSEPCVLLATCAPAPCTPLTFPP